MRKGTNIGSKDTIGRILILPAALLLMVPFALGAQDFAPTSDFAFNPEDVTFSRDIAPILQRSCQNCHNPVGVAPMPLVAYQDVRRFSRRIKERTAIRDRAGAMPPWYVEKNIGIQEYKQDTSLNDEEVAMIAAWADNGSPEGDPADLPPAREFDDSGEWTIRPDIVVTSNEILVRGGDADWWGEIESIALDLEEDRYVSAVQIREVNDVKRDQEGGRETVGGRYVVHHMIWRTQVLGTSERTSWPVHEVGRNPDIFDPSAGRLLKAGSQVASESIHLHSNGRDTRARLEIAFELHPVGYEPKYSGGITSLANGSDIDIEANMAGQRLDAYTVTRQHTKIISFEPHLHAPGERMCLEAIWGFKAETLSCAGYDHNWVPHLRLRRPLPAPAAQGHDPPHHRLHEQHRDEPEHPRPEELARIGQSVGGQHVYRSGRARRPHRRAVRGGDGRAGGKIKPDQERLPHRVPALLGHRGDAASQSRR